MSAAYIPASADATLSIYNRTKTAHGFTVGQTIYFDGTAYQLARSNAFATLAEYVVAAVVDANTFRLALTDEIVGGYTGLTAGLPAHCSSATAGAVSTAAQGTAPAGAVAQNVIGMAVSATQISVNVMMSVAV